MFEIFRFKIEQLFFGEKEGLLLRKNGIWSEVSPLKGRSRETTDEALAQLKAVQNGYLGPLLPSVAFGLFGLEASPVASCPVSLFLMGTPGHILSVAEKDYGCRSAKIKIGGFDIETAIFLVKTLKSRFWLRIDIGGFWPREKVDRFCSHFTPTDFEYIEDPGFDISPYPMAFEHSQVWKPMVRGIPPQSAPIILSSSYETGVGLHQIAALAHHLEIPAHPLGIGTFNNLKEDVLEEPLKIRDGHLIFSSRIKEERLTPC